MTNNKVNPEQSGNINSRRSFLKQSVGLAMLFTGCMPQEQGPGLPELEPGQYANEAYFQNQRQLFVPNGADGSRAVFGGISNSSGLIYNQEKKPYASAYPGQAVPTDIASRPGTSFQFMPDDVLRTPNDAEGFSPRHRANLDLIVRQYDGVILPVTPDYAALANSGSVYDPAPDALAQAKITKQETFDLLLAGLDARAARTERLIVVRLISPVFVIDRGSPYFDPDIDNAAILDNTASHLESTLQGYNFTNLDVSVNREFSDTVSDMIVSGNYEQALSLFCPDDPNVRQHVGENGASLFRSITAGMVDDMDARFHN